MPGVATREITFEGFARGGILSIADTMNINNPVVSIETKENEPAESVVTRLAEILKKSKLFGSMEGSGKNLIQLGGPPLCVGGTETGLGIPLPPKSLSVRYDPSLGQFLVEWEEPNETFDIVDVSIDSVVVGWRLPRSTEKFVNAPTHLFKGWEDHGVLVTVVGNKGGLYSAAGVVVFGCSQEERVNLPFSGGVNPNWIKWSENKDTDKLQFAFEVKDFAKTSDYEYPFLQRHEDKPTFQRIGSSSVASSGGIFRRFLGLVPGSTYRIRARVNTLQMTAAQGGWSFEVLAAYNPPGRKPLTPGQLSGVEPLPNGEQGKDAGILARFGPDRTTGGEWFEIDTSKSPDTSKQADITLPSDVDTITLWIRYQAESPTTGVGMDWVALEDLSCTN